MPKSSRHKPHKQSKYREHSESEEDSKKIVKERIVFKEETSVRVSKDLTVVVEKRNLESGKDLSGGYRNGDVLDEFVGSKRRKDKAEVGGGGDRWNGGGDERGDGVFLEKEVKGDLKSKILIDSKSKSSRRHDSSEKKEDRLVGLVKEKDESKGEKIELKLKGVSDRMEKEKIGRDSGRKESTSHYMDLKEKERGLERDRDRKVQDGKRGVEPRSVDSEAKRKHGSQLVDDGNDKIKIERGTANTVRPLEDDSLNHELEIEAEKQIRRKGDESVEKEKYQVDRREGEDRRLPSRAERDKDGRYNDERYKDKRCKEDRYKDERNTGRSYKEERHKDGSYRDKHRDDIDSSSRHRDGKQRGDIDREKKQQGYKYRDEHTSRDRPIDEPDSKRSRAGTNPAEGPNKKLRAEINDHDGSPICEDRSTRYKDNKVYRRSAEKEYTCELRSRNFKEHRTDLEKKFTTAGKAELVPDREKPRSRYVDKESPITHNRRRSSPNSISFVDNDQYRQAESNYRDAVQEGAQNYESHGEVAGGSEVTQKANLSRSLDKFNLKDDDHTSRLSAERRMTPDARNSSLQNKEKSPSSYMHRSGVRQSLDVEDSGQRIGGSRDLKDYSGNEGKRSKDLPTDSYSVNEHPQTDGENMSVSSPFLRTNYLQPSHSKSLLPPPSPFKAVIDNSSGFGSYEDDSRGMRNNRFKRIGDSNMNRVQANTWKGVPNWPSPMANGFIPYPHGPPPVGFHPMMQQFSTPPMYSVRPPIELNHPAVPFHIPDAERFANHGRPFEGWGPNNTLIGDGSHMYGRLDWDTNRINMSNGAWDASVDLWNCQDIGISKKLVSAPQVDKTLNTNEELLYDPFNQPADNDHNQPDLQAKEVGANNSGDVLSKDSFEIPKAIPGKMTKTSKTPRDDHVYSAHIYLSKLDLSDDLISPGLYNECTGLIHVKHDVIDDVDASSLVVVEGVAKGSVKIFNSPSNGPFFAAIDDSILKRAMSFYKKQKDEMKATILSMSNGEKVPSTIVSVSDKEVVEVPIPHMGTDKQGMLVATSDMPETENSFPTSNDVNEKIKENEVRETAFIIPKLKESHTNQNDKEDDASMLVEMPEKIVDEPNSTLEEVKMEVDAMLDEEMLENHEEKLSIASSKGQTTIIETEKTNMAVDDDDSASKIKEEKLDDTMFDPACEAVMITELNDFESSVNLSRIHHLPESTH